MVTIEDLTYHVVFYKNDAKIARVPCVFLAPKCPVRLHFTGTASSVEEKYNQIKENYTHYAIEYQGVVLYKQEI